MSSDNVRTVGFPFADALGTDASANEVSDLPVGRQILPFVFGASARSTAPRVSDSPPDHCEEGSIDSYAIVSSCQMGPPSKQTQAFKKIHGPKVVSAAR